MSTTSPDSQKDTAPEAPNAPEELRFQSYISSRHSMRMLTHSGKPITFINYKFITDDPEVISYLNNEIKSGLNVLTKGDRVSSVHSNPMEELRNKLKEELRKEMEEERDLGKTLTQRLSPLTSAQTATSK